MSSTANMSLDAFHRLQLKEATVKTIKYALLGSLVAAPLVAGLVEAATTSSMSTIYSSATTNLGGGAKVAGYLGGLFALMVAGYTGKWPLALGMGAGTIGAANWSSFNDSIFGALV
jgi:hypothetical protein